MRSGWRDRPSPGPFSQEEHARETLGREQGIIPLQLKTRQTWQASSDWAVENDRNDVMRSQKSEYTFRKVGHSIYSRTTALVLVL